MPLTIGILHPGDMGAAVGASFVELGHRVVWASDGRSATTRARADRAGLEDVSSVAAVVAQADVVVSVVPPSAAVDVAHDVAAAGVVLVDANAVSPDVARQVRDLVIAAGGIPVDGSIIGSPPRAAGSTRLFLSGADAPVWADRLGGGLLEVVALDGDDVAASALKMVYAAWSKGTDALLLAVAAAAEHHGVDEELAIEWARSQPQLAERLPRAASNAARKGWRWDGEMRFVAETLEDAGLPGGFHQAAADVFARSPRDEDAAPDGATLATVVAALTATPPEG